MFDPAGLVCGGAAACGASSLPFVVEDASSDGFEGLDSADSDAFSIPSPLDSPGSSFTRSCPTVTVSSSFTRSSLIVPASGALTEISIYEETAF